MIAVAKNYQQTMISARKSFIKLKNNIVSNKNFIKNIGVYLDQPALVKKLHKSMPAALAGGAIAYGLYDVAMSPETTRKDKFIQNTCVLSATVASALVATRGLKVFNKKIFDGLIELPHLHHKDVNEVLENVYQKGPKALIEKVLNDKVLKLKEINQLSKFFDANFSGRNYMQKIIPPPHSHKPFEELKALSLLGFFPVLGGVTGGIIGDRICSSDWKSKLPNKIKEGTYQYLNNIFLCNVGAGIALAMMNKFKVKSTAVRFASMLAGVIGVGLLAGSTIANFISRAVINPIFDKKNDKQVSKIDLFKNINSERHPEAIDLSLHVDDLASVGILSGIKWVAPILPVLYSVSGYRAGIGYRNQSHCKTES